MLAMWLLKQLVEAVAFLWFAWLAGLIIMALLEGWFEGIVRTSKADAQTIANVFRWIRRKVVRH